MIIRIKNLKAETLLGVYDEERKKLRTVILNLSIDYDHRHAVASDNINEAIDYATIEQTIVDTLREQRFQLIETLAEHVAQMVMGFAGVREVSVEIDKPGALKYADSVSVTHTISQ